MHNTDVFIVRKWWDTLFSTTVFCSVQLYPVQFVVYDVGSLSFHDPKKYYANAFTVVAWISFRFLYDSTIFLPETNVVLRQAHFYFSCFFNTPISNRLFMLLDRLLLLFFTYMQELWMAYYVIRNYFFFFWFEKKHSEASIIVPYDLPLFIVHITCIRHYSYMYHSHTSLIRHITCIRLLHYFYMS